MRFLKSVLAAVVVLVVLTVLSRYALAGAISPQMAGLGGAIAGIITWYIT